MKTSRFDAAQFTPTKWDTAEDKAQFANHFVNFLQQDCKATLFTKKFYNRLSMTFGHIAHYNQSGFYDTWFSSPEQRRAFIAHTLNHNPCGDPAWTYSDVESAIMEYLLNSDIAARYAKADDNATRTRELAMLKTLRAKYQQEETP